MSICMDPLPVIVERLKSNDDHAHAMIAISLRVLPEWQRQYAAPVLWNLYASAYNCGYNARVIEQQRKESE